MSAKMRQQLESGKIAGSPYSQHLGIRYCSVGEGTAHLQLSTADHTRNFNGVTHGGALFSLADAAMGVALFSQTPEGLSTATLESKINFTRPLHEGTVDCFSEVLHLGSRTAVLEARLEQEGLLIAKASATFALITPKDLRPADKT
ncbi:PaaI family thioesterase [Aestuariirhabdus sp. Z084]|uniref:PaaI family thioesterase n=1 Tax=Aestuariirhabdus haliotis TaxID=2918751 RepID=UPI00201B4307|nr:PaaI family thioesterase [Aestuariirhabdus haliotis]MCL6414383.1 PaaI family thioesterase [Aestuariirhabdus haliotis]MCL6418315.1 PaaI family thioesterase [Aestuariirhabdus haliotis]